MKKFTVEIDCDKYGAGPYVEQEVLHSLELLRNDMTTGMAEDVGRDIEIYDRTGRQVGVARFTS